MSWSERVAALPPRAVALVTAIAAIGGLAGAVAGVVTSNLPLALAAGAVTLGANLIPAVADWCRTEAAAEAARREYREQTREEMLAEIRAVFAPVEREFERDDDGRFQELVSAGHRAQWHRVR
jgi:hypothetical protein